MNGKRLFLFVSLVLVILLTAGCSPVTASEGIVVGSSYRLSAGETVNHDVAVFGGSVLLEKGSKINGGLAVFGGTVVVDGMVNGDLAAFGGVVSLKENAVIEGNVLTYGASVSTDEKAVIKGTIGSGTAPTRVPGMMPPVREAFGNWLNLVSTVFWRIFQSLGLAALAVLVALFMLRPMERVGNVITAQPALAGAMGGLTFLAVGGVSVMLVITIILIPVTILGLLALALGILFGWMVLGLVTGERIAHLFNQEWSGPVSAGVGTLVISLAASLVSVIPCVGWLIEVIALLVGLGAVALTRFGTHVYPRNEPFISAPMDPPSAPSGGVEVA